MNPINPLSEDIAESVRIIEGLGTAKTIFGGGEILANHLDDMARAIELQDFAAYQSHSDTIAAVMEDWDFYHQFKRTYQTIIDTPWLEARSLLRAVSTTLRETGID